MTLLSCKRQDDAYQCQLIDLGGRRHVVDSELCAGAFDPGHEHRPVQGKLPGQVEIAQGIVGEDPLRGQGRLAIVKHGGEHQVGPVDPVIAIPGLVGEIVALLVLQEPRQVSIAGELDADRGPGGNRSQQIDLLAERQNGILEREQTGGW